MTMTPLRAIIFCVVGVTIAAATGKSYPPRSYWRFEDSHNVGVDTAGHDPLVPTDPGIEVRWAATGGPVGAYLSFSGANVSRAWGARAGRWNCSTTVSKQSPAYCDGVTVEFLLRPTRYFNLQGFSSILESTGGGSAFNFQVLMDRHSYACHASNHAEFPLVIKAGADVKAPLEGVGRASPSWFHDGGWHHFAFRKRLVSGAPGNATCEASLWLDGQSPNDTPTRLGVGWNSTGPCGGGSGGFLSGENITFLATALGGDIDEVAIWETGLPNTLIVAHAGDALARHVPYRLEDPGGGPVPPPDPTVGALDPREFAPGTILPTPPHTPTRGVNASCLEQLQSYPAPRYPAGKRIRALSNVMAPKYMGGMSQPNVSKAEFVAAAVAIQAELAKSWNYVVILDGASASQIGSLYYNSTIPLMNAHPEWPVEIGIIRVNAHTQTKRPFRAAINSNSLPDSCYLQTKNGTFIDYQGRPVQNATKKRYLRITSAGNEAKVCPDAHFDSDGEFFVKLFRGLLAGSTPDSPRPSPALTRPVDYIWEDGEIFSAAMQAQDGLALDPVVLADYKAQGLQNVSVHGGGTGFDWRTFTSRWRLRITARFRDIFLEDSGAAALLANATYGEYTARRIMFRTPDCNESAALHSYGPDAHCC